MSLVQGRAVGTWESQDVNPHRTNSEASAIRAILAHDRPIVGAMGGCRNGTPESGYKTSAEFIHSFFLGHRFTSPFPPVKWKCHFPS